MAVEFTDANFDEMALASDKPVIIDFWAEWCGPCRMVTPIIQELAEEYDGKAVIGKLNVDQNPEVSMKYGIRSIPTVLYIKDGQVVDKQVGATSKATYASKLDAQLA
jgi:thioredoxin 1